MSTSPSPISIREVQPADIPEVVDFVRHARAGMFPMLDATVMPDDLQHFANTYLHTRQGRFLIARQGDRLLGVIGYLSYDGRFPQLDYQGLKVVEVVRLFIDQSVRRQGLAAQLWVALKATAAAQGVQVLYLHTHPFLPGAIEFWRRQGFAIIDVEDDPVWQTTHMQRLI